MDLKSLIQSERELAKLPVPMGRKFALVLSDKSLPFFTRALRVLFWSELEIEEHSLEQTYPLLHSQVEDLAGVRIFWIPHLPLTEHDSDRLKQKATETIELLKLYPLMNLILPWPNPCREWGPWSSYSADSAWSKIRHFNELLQRDVEVRSQIIPTEPLVYQMGYRKVYEPQWDIGVDMPWSSNFQIELASYIYAREEIANTGRRTHLLVDLDNVVWPGYLCETLPSLNNRDVQCKSLLSMQDYLLALRESGVELVGLMAGQERHVSLLDAIEGSKLRREHFLAILPGWGCFARRAFGVIESLGINTKCAGLVSADPLEISVMRESTPQLSSICLEADPCLRIEQMRDLNWFWRTTNLPTDAVSITRIENPIFNADAEDAIISSLDVSLKLKPIKKEDADWISNLQDCGASVIQSGDQSRVNANGLDFNLIENGLIVELEDQFGQHGRCGVVVPNKTRDGFDFFITNVLASKRGDLVDALKTALEREPGLTTITTADLRLIEPSSLS